MSAPRSGLGQEELALLTPQAGEESGLSMSDGAHREGGREPQSRRPWPAVGREGTARAARCQLHCRERKLSGYRDIPGPRYPSTPHSAIVTGNVEDLVTSTNVLLLLGWFYVSGQYFQEK